MTTATNNLSAAVQQLIDARLDNIERVLMASGTSRLERQEIIASVEDQIMELIARKGDGELERDQMLQILASLDPPEAYITEDDQLPAAQLRHSRQPENGTVSKRKSFAFSDHLNGRRLYTASFVSSLMSILAAMLFISCFGLRSEVPLLFSIATSASAFICGLVVLTNSTAQERAGSTWMSIVGITSLPLLLSVFTTLVILRR